MIKCYILLAVVYLIAGCGLQKKASHGKIIWQDEFNYNGLPDSNKWNYEVGFIRNEEAQYYQKENRANSFVQDGVLVLRSIKETTPNAFFIPNSNSWRSTTEAAAYSSASIITHKKFAFKYGRVEVRAKLPVTKGVWPAIWMLGENIDQVGFPACGEIVIMEYNMFEKKYVYGTVHYPREQGNVNVFSSTKKVKLPRSKDGFRTYSIEWNDKKIKFFIDRKPYHEFNIADAGKKNENPFHRPFYLIINLAMGAWGGKIDKSFKQDDFIIDYVRVYDK